MVSLLSEQLELVCLRQFLSAFFPCHAQCLPQLFKVCKTGCQVLLITSYWQTHPKMLQGLKGLLSIIDLSLIKM
jgi:hypothetical protein